jgi:hypothetical protein
MINKDVEEVLVAEFSDGPYSRAGEWEFDYMYPGFFSYTNGRTRVFFTPDFDEKGDISIQVTTEDGEYLRGDNVRYEDPLTPTMLFRIVEPWLIREGGGWAFYRGPRIESKKS